MMQRSRWVALFSLFVFLLAGCGHGGGSGLSSADLKSFDSATPEIKQLWASARETAKTNDYIGGATLFNELLNQELTPAQREAVSKESTALNQRLHDAAEKGNPEAQKALQELRHSAPGRPR